LADITPRNIGVEVNDGKMSILIPRNAELGGSINKIYHTLEDDQAYIQIFVYEGDHELCIHNRKLGEFCLFGIPILPKGEAKVKVTFELDYCGMLNITAIDMSN